MIKSAADVVEIFDKAQATYKQRLERKKYEKFGNEHFIRRTDLKSNLRGSRKPSVLSDCSQDVSGYRKNYQERLISQQ